MSKKTLLVLAIVLLVIVGAILVQRQLTQPKGFIEELAYVPLAPKAFLANKVIRVEIYSGAKPDQKVVLAKADDKWSVASEFNAPADGTKVKDLLEKIKKLEGERRADDPDVLGDFDLKDEQAVHFVVTSEGDQPPIHLLVGKAPDWQSGFVRQDGHNTVYAVSLNLRSEAGLYGTGAEQTPEAKPWLDLKVVALDKQKIRTLQLKCPDKSLSFEQRPKPEQKPAAEEEPEGEAAPEEKEAKAPEMEWVLASGGMAGEPFKQDGLDKLITALGELTAADVVDPAKKSEWALNEPAWQIDVTLDDGTKKTLLAGRPDLTQNGYVTLADSPTVYKVARWEFDKLFPKGTDLFELKGFAVPEADLAQVQTTSKAMALTFVREGDAWKLTEPMTGFALDDIAAKDLAQAVAEWKPQDYADGNDLAAYGLDPGKPTVTFKTKDGAQHALALGGRSKAIDGRYALKDGAAPVFAADQKSLEKLLPELRTVFKSDVLDVDPEKVQSIAVTRGESSYTLTRTADGWQLIVGGEATPADIEKVDALLKTLSPLEAEDFEPRAGAAKTLATITVRRSDVSEPLVLSISEDRRCTLPGRTLDALLAQKTIDELTPAADTLKMAPPPAAEQPQPAPPENKPEAAPAPKP